MAESIQQIIGKVIPEHYAINGSELLKKYGSVNNIPAKDVKPQAIKYSKKDDRFYTPDSNGVESSHTIIYDSSAEGLEPIYFYLVDLMSDIFSLKPEKLVDNFSSSPGSGHFAELGQRATIMQQQASKIMGDVNTVLRSVLNIIYDLKEFRIRLEHYNKLKSKDEKDREAAKLSLKQLWMDKVDITKGNSSIKAMAMQGGFQTLIHAFLSANEVKDVDKLDLNDVVKRILKPRVQEFNIWMEQSGEELKKRYELERTYLRSQVNSIQLYSRWVKPYLVAAQQLEMKEQGRNPAMVKSFNTIILELTLLGKKELDVPNEALKGNLSKEFTNPKIMKGLKKYYSCILVDLTFRGIPQRVSQQAHYSFGGRTDFTIKSYVMNEDQLNKFEEVLAKSEINDVLKLIEGATTESLKQLQEDIDFFLGEKSSEEKREKSVDTSNPFLALFGRYNEQPKKEEKSGNKKVIVRPETFIEKKFLRPLAEENAVNTAFTIFDVYKKAHAMPSYT